MPKTVYSFNELLQVLISNKEREISLDSSIAKDWPTERSKEIYTALKRNTYTIDIARLVVIPDPRFWSLWDMPSLLQRNKNLREFDLLITNQQIETAQDTIYDLETSGVSVEITHRLRSDLLHAMYQKNKDKIQDATHEIIFKMYIYPCILFRTHSGIFGGYTIGTARWPRLLNQEQASEAILAAFAGFDYNPRLSLSHEEFCLLQCLIVANFILFPSQSTQENDHMDVQLFLNENKAAIINNLKLAINNTKSYDPMMRFAKALLEKFNFFKKLNNELQSENEFSLGKVSDMWSWLETSPSDFSPAEGFIGQTGSKLDTTTKNCYQYIKEVFIQEVKNAKIKSLNLDKCYGFHRKDILDFFQAIKDNKNIIQVNLDINFTKMDKNDILGFIDTLKQNQNLRQLTLVERNINEVDRNKINLLIERNQKNHELMQLTSSLDLTVNSELEIDILEYVAFIYELQAATGVSEGSNNLRNMLLTIVHASMHVQVRQNNEPIDLATVLKDYILPCVWQKNGNEIEWSRMTGYQQTSEAILASYIGLRCSVQDGDGLSDKQFLLLQCALMTTVIESPLASENNCQAALWLDNNEDIIIKRLQSYLAYCRNRNEFVRLAQSLLTQYQLSFSPTALPTTLVTSGVIPKASFFAPDTSGANDASKLNVVQVSPANVCSKA